MIETILGQLFPIEYGIEPSKIVVPIIRHSTPFSVSDPKACATCLNDPNRISRANCNREILKINNRGMEIGVVNYEQYIAQFDKDKRVGERCDLLMTESGEDRRKIVFCDLCCQEEKFVEPNAGKYPQGKRAKARQQMERTIDFLIQQEVTAVNLLTYQEKICLFAWRDYDVPDEPVQATRGDARSNVQVFGSTLSNLKGITTAHHRKAKHDFTFVQVKYPTTYQW